MLFIRILLVICIFGLNSLNAQDPLYVIGYYGPKFDRKLQIDYCLYLVRNDPWDHKLSAFDIDWTGYYLTLEELEYYIYVQQKKPIKYEDAVYFFPYVEYDWYSEEIWEQYDE